VGSLNYTITKVGLTEAGEYVAGDLYFIVFPGLLTDIAAQAWSATTNYYVGQTCVVNYVVVNPNVDGLPAAALVLNGTQGTVTW